MGQVGQTVGHPRGDPGRLPRCGLDEPPVRGRHLRTRDDQVLHALRHARGGRGPGQVQTVPAAAHHRDDERAARGRCPPGRRASLGQQPREVHESGQLTGQFARGQGVVDGPIAVDPDPVEERGHAVDAHPLPLRSHRLGCVQHLAQAQHEARVRLRGPQRAQGLGQFAVDAEGVAVDDDDVRAERGEGGGDDGGPDVQHAAGLHRQGAGLVAVPALADPGHDDPVEAAGRPERRSGPLAGDEESGDGATGEGGQPVGQRLSDRQVATGVAQPHRVVGVQRDAQLPPLLRSPHAHSLFPRPGPAGSCPDGDNTRNGA